MSHGEFAYWFLLAILGHLIGDFLLQPKSWALRKSERSMPGFWYCTVHVVVYTAAVCAMLRTYQVAVVVLVFIPHWLIDRYSLASIWLKLIRGRSFEAAYASTDKFREFDIAFTSIVYTVTDATLHLLCLGVVLWLHNRYF
jgi:hypothetical protein